MDNIEKIKNFEYSDELVQICLAARICQYDKHGNRFVHKYDYGFLKNIKNK